jgi:membrane protease YdiL (CAAX protease family)
MGDLNARALAARESTGLGPQTLLVVFCLMAGLAYRASVSLIPSAIGKDTFIISAAALLLVLALAAKRTNTLAHYWEIPFAFFVFYVAGFFGDGNISPIQHFFVSNVLHESTSANNPLASTVTGTVLAQLGGTILLAAPIVALTIASGRNLDEIFIARPNNRWGLVVGVICFAVIWFLALRGRTVSFFPIHGELTTSRFLSLTPALVVLVLLNGFREELFFRGLFLNKYGRFLSPVLANVLAAVIFTSFHVEVKYAASVLIFLVYTLINGLILGWLMQRSGSLLASTIFHAGTDIPIFLVYLSYATT